MSYYMQNTYTRAWHRATAREGLLGLPSLAGGGCDAGAWEGGSEAPARQGNSLALGRTSHRSLQCCGLCSSPHSPPRLPPPPPCLQLLVRQTWTGMPAAPLTGGVKPGERGALSKPQILLHLPPDW